MLKKSWSFVEVEERLVEAATLWLRTPADSGIAPRLSGPFATDAPWQMLTRIVRAGSAMDAWRLEQEELAARDDRPQRRVMGLTSEEVGLRDEATAWLLIVPEVDRRVVALAIVQQARSGKRTDWGRVMADMGISRGKDGLRMRYNRSITAIARALSKGAHQVAS